MAQSIIKGVRITHISSAVPKEVLRNMDYEWITEEERKFLIKNTGVEQRRFAGKSICTSDMCVAAAQEMFKHYPETFDGIDLIVFVTQSPDYVVPATSMLIQHRLGLPNTVAAFDVNLGCSGYIYGLNIATSMLQNGGFRKALLMAGDRTTDSQNYRDKTSYPIFGDAGTVTLLEYTGDNSDVFYFDLHSDGSRYDAIHIPHGGTRIPFSTLSEVEEEFEPGVIRSKRNLHMDGMGVFNFSLDAPPQSALSVSSLAGFQPSEFDWVILHQANKLINETIRKKLKVLPERCPSTLAEFGNTSSASIPITLTQRVAHQHRIDGNMLLSGFGVGLSWGSCVHRFKEVKTTNLSEL
jgi:3-oxoacyl-[acyl-carrier-protein] synthase-3